jgi:hypothetical protein
MNTPGCVWNPVHAAIENMQPHVLSFLLRSGSGTKVICGGLRPIHHAIDIETEAAEARLMMCPSEA